MNSLQLNGSRAVLTDRGATFPDDMTFQEWLSEGRKIYHDISKGMLWLGDWLNFGKAKYGEKYREAIKLTGYDPGTLRDAAWVSRSVEMSLRNDNLPWNHHRVVARLEPKDQRRYLSKAEEGEWSVSDLRRAIRADEADPFREARARPPWSAGAWASDGVRHLRQWINDEPISQWPQARRDALKSALHPIIEIWEQL